MIRYGGWILKENNEEFMRHAMSGNIDIQKTIGNSGASFYVVYLTSREDELVFRLKYPFMIKEIDDTIG